MRIISGKFGGRRFTPPADNWPTRPTTDIAKEGLFNILNHELDYANVSMLDLFGGTGNHCYEFISRGCKDCTYVDKYLPAIKFVEGIKVKLDIHDTLHVVRSDVFKFIALTNRSWDYIFAGPPYPLKNIPDIPDLIFEKKMLANGGLFVLEHNPDHHFEGHIHFSKYRNYGTTIFSFFE